MILKLLDDILPEESDANWDCGQEEYHERSSDRGEDYSYDEQADIKVANADKKNQVVNRGRPFESTRRGTSRHSRRG